MKSMRKPGKINYTKLKNQLFISVNGSENMKSSLLHMFRNIRKENAQISSVKIIRSSVIGHWLKSYNLRQVQYMAGHKYVSSTERYKGNNLEDLKKNLEEFHPLK
jgi:integrase/recombinase XerD